MAGKGGFNANTTKRHQLLVVVIDKCNVIFFNPLMILIPWWKNS